MNEVISLDSLNKENYDITLATLERQMQPIMDYMIDPNVFEIYVNPDGRVWLDTFQKGRTPTDMYMEPAWTKQIIISVAALTNQILPEEMPILSAELPDTELFSSSRFQGNLPDVVPGPTINIRKHPKKILSLEDYVRQGTLTEEQYGIIIEGIHNKKNIIAAGGTKSGKTTFLNAILGEISKLDDRVIMIEDTPELRCSADDYVSMRTTRHVTMSDCIKSVLRMTPDRIVIGEVRGEEALDLLTAWSTGHSGGCSTIHSNSAEDTLTRLEGLIRRVSQDPQKSTIAEAVDYVVYLKYSGKKRYIESIIEIKGYDGVTDKYIINKL